MGITPTINWFSLVWRQWIGSLRIFLPANFKLLFLVTLNAWIQALKIIFKYFWWLIVLIPLMQSGILGVQIYSLLLINILTIALGVITILAIRPSVQKKDMRYFLGYWYHFILFKLYWVIVGFIMTIILSPIALFFGKPFFAISSFFFFYLYSYGMFFFLDARATVVNAGISFLRGLRMTIYGLPFNIIVGIFFGYLYFFIMRLVPPSLVMNIIISYCYWLLLFVVTSFFLTLLNNFYIKQAHENYEIYFR
jgi:hypothetical protein